MTKVLIACEESQTVCKSFRKLGIEAYSCDILPCSGGHPEWHIQKDIRNILNDDWDLIIAHPHVHICQCLAIDGLMKKFMERQQSKEKFCKKKRLIFLCYL